MKNRIFTLLAIVAVSLPTVAFSQKDKDKKKDAKTAAPAPGFVMQNKIDSVSYAIGVSINNNLHAQGFDSVNADALRQGILDVITKENARMNPEQANKLLQEYFSALQAKKGSKCKTDGEAFLARNAKKPNIKTLPDGLQYEVLTEGTGPMPTATDKVKTHYHGTLIDGTVFDSSVQRGEPVTFPVNGVIKGWTEALQMMKVGSKWRLFIPYNLAYGEQGAGGQIEPYSALIFEVELLSIEK